PARKRVAGSQACGGGHRRPKGCRRRRGSTPGARRSRQAAAEEEEEGPALTPPVKIVPPVLTSSPPAGTIGSRGSEREGVSNEHLHRGADYPDRRQGVAQGRLAPRLHQPPRATAPPRIGGQILPHG